mgnify:CR=1 FL=1
MEYCESNIPLCRENQFKQLSQAVFNNFRLIIVSGPVSSGKTTTVKRFFDQILKETIPEDNFEEEEEEAQFCDDVQLLDQKDCFFDQHDTGS